MARLGKRHLKALRSLDRLVFPTSTTLSREEFHQRRITKPGAYRVSVLFRYSGAAHSRGYITVRLNRADVAVFPISSQQRFATSLATLSQSGTVSIGYTAVDGKPPIMVGVGIRKVAELANTIDLLITPSTICAAIATYPARGNVLRNAIDSLYHQTDHVFVYLNNYRSVPEYFDEYDVNKFHYVIDTASTLRASAKFFWTKQHDCYWAICDDDIIYPPDYLRTLRVRTHKGVSPSGVT